MTDCVKKCSFPILGLSLDCLEDCLPTCTPRDKREGYEILGRKQGVLGTFPIDIPLDLPGPVTPVYSPPTDADIETVAGSPRWLRNRGFEELCKRPQRRADGETGLTWYAAKKFAGIDRLLIAGGLSAADVHNTLHSAEMELTAADVASLRKALDLKEYDIGCMPSVCPKEDAAGDFSTGKYRFSNKLPSLERWIGILEKGPADGVSEELRAKVLDYLRKAHAHHNKTFDFQETMKAQNLVAVTSAVLLGVFVGYPFVKDMIAWYRGRVTFTDFEAVLREKLKVDPQYNIGGRDAEAKMAWDLADTHPEDGYRHVIFDAPTGEGKDVIVEKMFLMKLKNDPIVPEHFRKAPVRKINAAEFQADTKYRGTVADKVAEIAKLARKGPVIVYISEIDLIFLSGGTSSGDSEAVGKLLLDVVEDPKVRQNLLVIGTTSRGRDMLEKFPDLGRRFNWPQVRPFALSEVAELITRHVTGRRFAERHGVTATPEIADAATRLAEAFYRPVTMKGVVMPRFDAIKQLLTTAVRVAHSLNATALTIDHVFEAMFLRTGIVFDPEEMNAVLKVTDMNDIPAVQSLANAASSARKSALRETTRALQDHPACSGLPAIEIESMSREMLKAWLAMPRSERHAENTPPRSWIDAQLSEMEKNARGVVARKAAERAKLDKDGDHGADVINLLDPKKGGK